MNKYRPTEQELIEHLGAYGAHADELAELLPHEAEPMEKLKKISQEVRATYGSFHCTR